MFETRAGDGIAVEHDADAGRDRQHVGSHRVELFVRNLDERETEIQKPLAKRHGQEPGIDDRQVAIDGTDHRHEMKDV